MEEPVIYRKSEEFFITPTGIRMSRDATIYSPESIVMGGKNVVFEGVVIRGDLRKDKANTTSINMGRYTYLEKNVVIRPPFRLYKSDFLYHPIKVGDYVFIGEGTVVNAASISSNVQIGKNCVIVRTSHTMQLKNKGRFAVIKSCVKILDNTVIPPHAVVPSHTVFGGSPGKQVGELSDFTSEIFETLAKDRYRKLQLH